jgi:HAD superfamily hydrolase (TIGR01549 family)
MTDAVLFDLDDTLFDHQHSTRAALTMLHARYSAFAGWSVDEFVARNNEQLEQLHLRVLAGTMGIDDARIQRFGTLFTSAGQPQPIDVIRRVAAQYRESYVAARQLVDGALDVVRTLASKRRVGVVTNNVVPEQLQKIADLGLEPWLHTVVISDAVGVTKPAPRIFRIALDRLGVDAASAVMVGDAWGTDIAGARAAGIDAVWFNRAGRPAPAGAPPVRELRSFVPEEYAVAVILEGGVRLPGAGSDAAPGDVDER